MWMLYLFLSVVCVFWRCRDSSNRKGVFYSLESYARLLYYWSWGKWTLLWNALAKGMEKMYLGKEQFSWGKNPTLWEMKVQLYQYQCI
jgi:hypothetical protein